MRTGPRRGKSGLRAQNRRIQPILTALLKSWRIAQGLNCTDRSKRCSASSFCISLSGYSESLFCVRSGFCGLLIAWLTWLNGHTVTLSAHAKIGATNIAWLDLTRQFLRMANNAKLHGIAWKSVQQTKPIYADYVRLWPRYSIVNDCLICFWV